MEKKCCLIRTSVPAIPISPMLSSICCFQYKRGHGPGPGEVCARGLKVTAVTIELLNMYHSIISLKPFNLSIPLTYALTWTNRSCCPCLAKLNWVPGIRRIAQLIVSRSNNSEVAINYNHKIIV